MRNIGKKELTLSLNEPLDAIPEGLADWPLELRNGGTEIRYTFDVNAERTGVPSLLRRVTDLGLRFSDLNTRQSSLEDIFVSLVRDRA